MPYSHRRLLLVISVLALLSGARTSSGADSVLDTLSGEGLIEFIDRAIGNRNWNETRLSIEKWLETGEKNSLRLVQLGQAQMHLGKEKDAEKSFKKALSEDKQNMEAIEGLLEVYLIRKKKKDMLKTLESFKKAGAGEDKARYYEALAVDRFNLKGYDEAFFWDTLEDIVRSDSANIKVLNVLCDAYIEDRFFERGILFINELIDSGMESPELLFQLARIYTNTGDNDLAREMFTRIEKDGLGKLTPRQRFLMSREMFRLEEPVMGCDAYFSAARNMDDGLAQEVFDDLRDIVKNDEKREFKYTPTGKKGIFLISFWGRKDPTPTTVKNERLVEHYRRIEYVKEKYRSALRPGYDERGRVYIKHGEPDQTISLSGNWAVRENVSWLYSKKRSNPLIYHFVERNNYYRMAYRLEEALIPDMQAEINMGARNIESLFRSRAEIHPKYDQLANEITRIQGSYEEARHGYLLDLFTDEEMLTERGFIEGETTETFEFEYEEEPMNFYYMPVTLKASDSLSALGVYFALPTDQVKVFDPFGTVEVPVELEVVVYDSWWQEVKRIEQAKTYRVPNFIASRETMIPDLMSTSLDPGYYHLAVRMKQTGSDLMQIYKSNYFVPSYRSPDSLYISDLILASSVEEDTRPGKFNIHGYRISPMPSISFKQTQPIFIFYEIYNLEPGSEERKIVKIEYQVTSASGSLSLAKKIIRSLGRFIGVREEVGRVITTFVREIKSPGPLDPVYLSIDPTGYTPGSYNIMVSVRDSIGGQAAAKDATFIISD